MYDSMMDGLGFGNDAWWWYMLGFDKPNIEQVIEKYRSIQDAKA